MTTTIPNPAGVRRLVVGLWTRHLLIANAPRTERRDLALVADGYTEAAHVALTALGCSVPPAPFGLTVIVKEALADAGPMPPATDAHARPIWREQLTDAIIARITP